MNLKDSLCSTKLCQGQCNKQLLIQTNLQPSNKFCEKQHGSFCVIQLREGVQTATDIP